MRGLAVFLLICVFSPAVHADEAADRTAQQVIDAQIELDRAEGAEAYAKDNKREKTNLLISAKNRLNKIPGWRVITRGRVKKDVNRKRNDASAAAQQAKLAEQQTNQTGQQYIQAEEIYKAENGTYSNPDRVQYWQSKLNFVPVEENPDQEVTSETVDTQTSNLMDTIGGGLDAGSMGQLSGQAGQIENMTDKLVAQALAGKGQFDPSRYNTGASKSPPGGANRQPDFSKKKFSTASRPKPVLGSISEQTLHEGKVLLSDGRTDRLPRRRSDPYAEQSSRKLAEGDAEGALKAAEKTIARNPNSPTGYVLKARALNKLRRFDEAENAALRALERDPDNEKSYKSLIWAQLHNGKADEASRNASRLIRIHPDNAEAFLMRAFAKELLGDREGMMRDLERAARLDPKYRGHLAKARKGERLFDPNNADSERLLDAMAYEEPEEGNRSLPFIAIGLGLLLSSLSAPAFAWYRRQRKSTVGAGGRTSTLEFERRTDHDEEEEEKEAASELLGGKYHLEQMIGRGGMGKVWKAVDKTLDRPVAIKQMVELETSDLQRELLELYRKEARTLANLHHPAIVDIYEVLDLKDGIYLVFEWVEGKTVQQLLAEEHKLPLHRVLSILEPVLEALAFAHREGVVHRDMKPANIMVNASGHVKLMDFGIARAVGNEQVPESVGAGGNSMAETRTNTVAGTPAYRGPEAIRGIVTPAFDIYGIGATFYEMLTGRLPFGPSGQESVHATPFVKASQIAPGLPPNADAVVAFCLQQDYRKRFADVPSLLKELKKL